jgi:HEPN domain-containing protein
MKIEKQIEYWYQGAIDDLETAEILIDKKKILHGLFFCHLATEKILKAYFVKCTTNHPPKTHNLFFLLENLEIEINEETEIFLGLLMKYQLEGRYPDYKPEIPSNDLAKEYFLKSKNFVKWIKNKL